MRVVAYSEKDKDKSVLDLLIKKDTVGGYWCYTCEYFKPDATSPTQYRCQNYGFPDRAHGCCAGWSEK